MNLFERGLGGHPLQTAHLPTLAMASTVIASTMTGQISPSKAAQATDADCFMAHSLRFTGQKGPQNPNPPKAQPTGKSTWRGFLQTLTTLALTTPSLFYTPVLAQGPNNPVQLLAPVTEPAFENVSPTSQQVLEYAGSLLQKATTESLPRQEVHWQRMRSTFLPLAQVGEKNVAVLAKQLTDRALSNQDVPTDVLQDMFASLACFPKEVLKQDPVLQDEFIKLIKPFVQINSLTGEAYPNTPRTYQGTLSLREAAEHALAQLGNTTVLAQYGQTYRDTAEHTFKQRILTDLEGVPASDIPLSLLNQVQTDIERYNTTPPLHEKERELWGKQLQWLSQTVSQEKADDKPINAELNAVKTTAPSLILKAVDAYFPPAPKEPKATQDQKNIRVSESDFEVLNALGRLATLNDTALSRLKTLWTSHPELMLISANAHVQGDHSAASLAGEQALQAIQQHGLRPFQDLLIKMATADEPEVVGTTTGKPIQSKPTAIDRGRAVALAMMASKPDAAYRPILLDTLAQGDEWSAMVACIGLANLHQPQDISALARIANNPTQPERVRNMAGQALLKIGFPKELPQSLQDKIDKDFPLYEDFSQMVSLGGDGSVTRQVDVDAYQRWSNDLNDSTSVTPPDTLKQLGQDATFQQDVLEPTVALLKTGKHSAGRLINMLMLAKWSQYSPAHQVVMDIMASPRQFIDERTLPIGVDDQAMEIHRVKMAAIRALGGTLSMDSPEKHLGLLNLLPQTESVASIENADDQKSMSAKFTEYEYAVLNALSDLGQRYQALEKEKGLSNSQKETRTGLVRYLGKLLQQVDSSLLSNEQTPQAKSWTRYLIASTMIKLEGTDALLQRMKQTDKLARDLQTLGHPIGEDNNDEAQQAVAWAHLQMANNFRGHLRDMAFALISQGQALDDPLIKPFLDKSFWQMDKVKEQATGKGQTVILFDGNLGYEIEVPAHLKHLMPNLQGKMKYRQDLKFRPRCFKDGYHWLRVLSVLMSVAPDIEAISTRTWDSAATPPKPHMTPAMNYVPILEMMELVRCRMLPENHPDHEKGRVINNSWGNYSNRIYDNEARQGYNILSGLYEAFEATGGTTVFSGGNGGLDRALQYFAEERGNSPIGDGFTRNGECLPSKGVFYALPDDPWMGKITTRASVPVKPVDANRTFFKIPGVHTVLNYDGGTTNQLEAHHGSAASSYAAPVLAGMLLNANQLDKKASTRPMGSARLGELSRASAGGEFGTKTLQAEVFLAQVLQDQSNQEVLRELLQRVHVQTPPKKPD